MARELRLDELRWRCPESWIAGKGTHDVKPAEGIVGQDRAVEAIKFGLGTRGIGYNVFVTGLSGTGRLTTIKRFLDHEAQCETSPDDVCFVFNFTFPETPSVLMLSAGAGKRLRDEMEHLVSDLSKSVPELLAAKESRRRAEVAVEDLQRQERELTESFEKEVSEAGFKLVQIQTAGLTRPEVLPAVEDEPVPLEQLPGLVEQGKLSEEQADTLRERHEDLRERLQEIFEKVGELREEMQERVEKVRLELVQPLLNRAVERVRKSVGDERAESYLNAVRRDLEENIELLAGESEDTGALVRWRVNLAVDNGHLEGRPVVIETEPTYSNLFGLVERRFRKGEEVAADLTHIRAGSLLKANGGFLVINADDALTEARVWPALKRALKYSRVQIQALETIVFGASALKPDPVPLDVKVVVIGDRGIYDVLFRYDRDFSKIFKVLADFDNLMPAEKERAEDVASVLAKVSDEEDLKHLDRSGLGAMLEEAVRLGRWRRRFSSRFSDLADVLRESSFLAEDVGSDLISGEIVRRAVAARKRRHGLTEDRIRESLREGVVEVASEGSIIGQVNGLVVYNLGHHTFGKPARITARLGLGRDGVINVERKAGLSGSTYDKGVQILTGFLRGTFGRRVPLNMSCSITFEQSYGGVDGDSASSTEIYAILSVLSDLPVRQDIAVTGSVDQYGTIQPIGGVNEKVEGFFALCRDRGLTGSQGVLIPARNVEDLQLDHGVLEAVEQGTFHVWAVDRIEEGIELLLDTPAGSWDDEEERWTPDSVFARCQETLGEMVRELHSAGKADDDGDKDDEEASGNESDPS